MNLDALGRLVWERRRPPRGLDPGQAAVTALPEVSDGLPVMIARESSWSVYSACGEPLEGPIRHAFESALREAEGPVSGVPDGDPLTAALCRLIAEGLLVSPGAGLVPLLEVVRQTAALLSAPPVPLAVRIANIRAMAPEQQGTLLGKLAGRIQVRMAAALASLGSAGVRVPALAQAVVSSRFAVLFERGALDLEASLPLLAAVHGAGVPPATVLAGAASLRAAISGVLERRTANRSTPDDMGFILRHLPPDLADRGADDVARALGTDADAVAWILPQLSRFTDVKALGRAGIPAPLAKDLLRPEQGLALASALAEVLRELRRWDVISALAAAVTPVADTAGRSDRALMVPHGPVHAVVVAVGLGRLRRPRAGVEPMQVERAWAESVSGLPGCVHADLGHCALVVFLDALAAFRFALRVGQRFPDEAPAVGIGVGEVFGGTDGEVVRLGGPAVEAALQWLALGPLPPRAGMDGTQALGLNGGRLCGHGVGIEGAAADAIEGARHAAGLVGPRDAAPAGDARMPRSLDTLRVFEFDDEVVALVRVSGVSGGFEAVRFSLADWIALLDRDSAASLPHSGPVAAVQRQTAARGTAPRASPIERIEMPDPLPRPPSPTPIEPFTVIESVAGKPRVTERTEQEATPDRDFDPFADAPPVSPTATGASSAGGFSAFADPFAGSAGPERPLVLDLDADEPQESGFGADFGAHTDSPVAPDSWPDVRHDVLAGGWAEGWTGKPEPSPEPAPAPVEIVTPETGDFTSFFLPGVQEPARKEGGVDVDIDDEPSVLSHSGMVVPSAPPATPPLAGRPQGQKTPRGGADGEAEFTGRQRVRPPADSPNMDFEFLLRGYCTFNDGNQVVFGRPYGARIVDRHAYPFYGDIDDAYRSFLQDKIGEGFAPRTELVGDLPRGVTLAPLEGERLTKAWRLLS